MFPARNLLLLKVWKWEYYNEKIEDELKLLRSSKMLRHREIKNPNFSFAQVYSNDCVASQHSKSPFIEEMDNIGCSNGYNIYTDIFTWLQLHSHGYSRLYYFTNLALGKNSTRMVQQLSEPLVLIRIVIHVEILHGSSLTISPCQSLSR